MLHFSTCQYFPKRYILNTMKNYYPGNVYNTPLDNRRDWGDYLVLGTRWYFYYNILSTAWRARNMVLRDQFTDSHWAQISNQMLRCHERSGAKCHFMGLDNISAHDGPVIFIGNHMSTAETFLMPSIIVPRKKMTFVVKQALLNYPGFGTILRSKDPVSVGRKDPKEDFKAVMTQGKEKLGFGTSLVVFPQSTRMSVFSPKNFNSIGIKLAKKTGVPIVPFALKTDFWGNGSVLRDFGPVSRDKDVFIEFAKPLTIDGSGKAEHQYIIDFIQEKLLKWEKDSKHKYNSIKQSSTI